MLEFWNAIADLCITYGWVCHVFIAVLLTAVVHFIEVRFFTRVVSRLNRTHNIWDVSFFGSLSAPIGALIWLLGLIFAADIIVARTPELIDADTAFSYIPMIRGIGIIAIVTWFFWRFVSNVEKEMLLDHDWRKPSDRTTVNAVARLLRLVVLITGGLVLLQNLGIPVTGVWAFGGGGAIIAGIAAKDLLANFFGGLMIYLDRPFKVGDWISSPDRNIEGTVQHIGWRLTRVLTFDKRPLYIPNSVFSTISIQNPQRMTNRRIATDVGVRYDDASKLRVIVEDIKAMLQAHEGIDITQSLMVHFVSFGASALNINIYCFTKTTYWATWRDVQQEIFLNILDIIAKHGAEVAFPTQTLHVNGVPGNQA